MIENRNDEILIIGGTLIDASGTRQDNLGISRGVIVDPDALGPKPFEIDASSCVVSTGLVDLHAHLGEPGNEAAETIESAGRAAVAGGFTTIQAMPNSVPPVDTAAVVEHVRALSQRAACKIEICGTVTVGGHGHRLAPLGELATAGVRMVSDCSKGIQDAKLMRRALEYAKPLGLVIAQPADCAELSEDAQMHEGEWSARLGLAGAPAESEEIMVMRDVSLSRMIGARLHFQTLSTAGSFAIVGAARRSGVAVTAEVTAAHLALSAESVASFDSRFKVWPPLREPSDQIAAKAGVVDGSVDAIVSDHTPRTTDCKERPFDQAEIGSTGLETTLAATLSSGLPLASALAALSWRPAAILGLGDPETRCLSSGARADVTVFDPTGRYVVRASSMQSVSSNTAFEGSELTGVVCSTIVDGQLRFHEGKPCHQI